MTLLRRLASIVRWIARRDRAEKDLDDELRAFVEMAAADQIRDGAPPEQAQRHAVLHVGGLEQAKERVRTGRHGAWLDEIGRDLRYGLRTLRATPLVTLVVILSLALGIGANTAMFSIVNSLLLRALPVDRPDRLVLLHSNPSVTPSSPWSNPVWERIRDHHADLFDVTFAFSRRTTRFNFAQRGQTEFIDGVYASGRYFEALGVTPMLGRTFAVEDDRRGGGPNGPVAVISYALWQRRFGGSTDVIGRKQTIDRVPFTIVGVMPPGFFGTDVGTRSDVILPIGTEPLLRGRDSQLDRPTTSSLLIMARLKDGQTIASAEQALRGIQPQIRDATMPASARADVRARYMATPFAVADATYLSLRDRVPPTMYVPLAQQPAGWGSFPFVTLSVRSANGSAVSVARSVSDSIARVDRDIAMTFTPLRQQVDAALVQERILAMLSGGFSALALLLSALGLYGVTAYAVNRRRTEIGIRMAIGAAPARVIRLVLGRVTVLIGIGVLVGIGASVWASRLVATLLYGLEPRDLDTLVSSAAALAAVGVLAGWLPAYRASSIDPAEVLREGGKRGQRGAGIHNVRPVIPKRCPMAGTERAQLMQPA